MLSFVRMTSYFLLLTSVVSAEEAAHGDAILCPSLWTAWHGNCYRYFGNQYLKWNDGENYCRHIGWQNPINGQHQTGAHLVSLRSYDEEKFVIDLWTTSRDATASTRGLSYESIGPVLLIGLNDIETEGRHRWTDGSAVTYTRWMSGEPNNSGGNEDAAHIWLSQHRCGHLKYCWNDTPVSSHGWRAPFVCKIPGYRSP